MKPARVDDVFVDLSGLTRRRLERVLPNFRFHLERIEILFLECEPSRVFWVAAKKDIRAATRHIGGDGDRAGAPSLRDNLRFHFVIFRVQDHVFDATALETLSLFFQCFSL